MKSKIVNQNGKIDLNGQIVEEDSALYAQDSARITAMERSI